MAKKRTAKKKIVTPKDAPIPEEPKLQQCETCQRWVKPEKIMVCRFCNMRWCKKCDIAPFNRCPTCDHHISE